MAACLYENKRTILIKGFETEARYQLQYLHKQNLRSNFHKRAIFTHISVVHNYLRQDIDYILKQNLRKR